MDREEAIDLLDNLIGFIEDNHSSDYDMALKMAIEALSEQKVGKWVYNADYSDRLICSECNAKFDMWKWEMKQMHFCPNCGARMESEDK